jgi:flagellar protein FlaG
MTGVPSSLSVFLPEMRTTFSPDTKMLAVVGENGIEVALPIKQEVGEAITKDQISEIVKKMNDFLTPSKTSLKFQLHEKLQEYYVSVIDERTKEVVREIPPKKLLDVYAAMTEFLGLFVDKKI